MSEDIVDKPFDEASGKAEDAHEQAVKELRDKVAKAKSEALKKLGS